MYVSQKLSANICFRSYFLYSFLLYKVKEVKISNTRPEFFHPNNLIESKKNKQNKKTNKQKKPSIKRLEFLENIVSQSERGLKIVSQVVG